MQTPITNNNNNNNHLLSSPNQTQIYSESLDQSPSYLTDIDDSNQLNSGGGGGGGGGQYDLDSEGELGGGRGEEGDEIDSLMDVSPEELELRVIELLNPIQSNEILTEEEEHIFKIETLIGKFGWNLPRKKKEEDNLEKEEDEIELNQEELMIPIQSYLKKCLKTIDESDWMFKSKSIEGSGGEEEGTRWIDQSFNLESYRVDHLTTTTSTTFNQQQQQQQPQQYSEEEGDEVEIEGDSRFGDDYII